jgi:Asp-tRNA(Asn)/Glu-tRNA(Gln) amidotransferase A subunit family amidase
MSESQGGSLITGIGDELDLLDLAEVHTRLVYGELSSAQFVQRCLDRIAGYDKQLGAVVAVHPTAMEQAERSDRRHADGDDLGPLDGDTGAGQGQHRYRRLV